MRITKAIRTNIMQKVVAKAFEAQITEKFKKLGDASRAAFAEIYKEEIAATKNIPVELRDSILTTKAFFHIKLDASDKYVRFPRHVWSTSDNTSEYYVDNNFKYVYGHMRSQEFRSNFVRISLQTTPVNYIVIKQLIQEIEELFSSAAALRDQIMAVLESTCSSKKLIEMAPELADYFPKDEVVMSKAVLPLATVNSVRAVLQGLKPQPVVSGDEEESE